MTELETMKRAKMYIDKLSNGINPLDNTNVSEDDIINNVRISRCFFYISNILRQVIENNGCISKTSGQKEYKNPFAIPADLSDKYIYSDIPITITEITNRINSLIDLNTTEKLKVRSITNWLVEEGLLEIIVDNGGKKRKSPTTQGDNLGIILEWRSGPRGDYFAVTYNINAQRFIIDNLYSVVEMYNQTNK